MKEMIQELTKRFDRWARANAGDLAAETGLFDTMGRSLIAVMERLDAMEQPPRVAWTAPITMTQDQIDNYMATGKPPITDEQRKDIERAAMIKALRWIEDKMSMWPEQNLVVRDAIARLENGGDL